MWKNVINPVFRRGSNVNPLVSSSFRALRLAQGGKRMGPGFRVPRRRPLRGCELIRRADFVRLFLSRAKFGEKSEYRSRIGLARFCRASAAARISKSLRNRTMDAPRVRNQSLPYRRVSLIGVVNSIRITVLAISGFKPF